MTALGIVTAFSGFCASAREVRAVVVEDDARAAAVAAIAARRDDRGHAFLGHHLQAPAAAAPCSRARARRCSCSGHWRVDRAARSPRRIGLHLLQLRVGVAMEQRLGDVRRGTHRAQQDDLAGELALELVEVLRRRRGRHRPPRRSRALWSAGDQGAACSQSGSGSGETIRAQVLICCQPMPNSPQSSRCAFSRPMAGQRIARPGIRLGHVGRAGEPRADAIRQALRRTASRASARSPPRGCAHTSSGRCFPRGLRAIVAGHLLLRVHGKDRQTRQQHRQRTQYDDTTRNVHKRVLLLFRPECVEVEEQAG